MKRLLLPAFALFTTSLFAQNFTVKEEVVAIDGMSRNSLTIMIDADKADDVKKAWKKKLKETKGKVNDKTIIFGDDCKLKTMGDNSFDVYSVVEDATEDGVRLVVAFDLGGAYLSTTDHPNRYPAAEKFVRDFAVEQAREVVNEEIKVMEKVLKGFEKEQSGLEKEKKDHEKSIEDYKKKIEEAKANIEKNVAAQANKKTEIEGTKAAIMDLEKKLKSIK